MFPVLKENSLIGFDGVLPLMCTGISDDSRGRYSCHLTYCSYPAVLMQCCQSKKKLEMPAMMGNTENKIFVSFIYWKFLLFVYFCSAGDQTQGCAHARKVLTTVLHHQSKNNFLKTIIKHSGSSVCAVL
jgi:hypothetical protein